MVSGAPTATPAADGFRRADPGRRSARHALHELGAQSAGSTAPASVSIPRLHVRAATSAAGLASDDRSLALPPSARAVVWWAYGASPGASSGTVLLAGHVSWNGRLGVLPGCARSGSATGSPCNARTAPESRTT